MKITADEARKIQEKARLRNRAILIICDEINNLIYEAASEGFASVLWEWEGKVNEKELGAIIKELENNGFKVNKHSSITTHSMKGEVIDYQRASIRIVWGDVIIK